MICFYLWAYYLLIRLKNILVAELKFKHYGGFHEKNY